MDSQLSKFITETGAEPGLARDLLEAKKGSYDDALKAYLTLHKTGLTPDQRSVPKKPAPQPVAPEHATPQTSPVSSRPPGLLLRGRATEMDGDHLNKKLKRGLSKTTENIQLINKARSKVLSDIQESGESNSPHFVETPEFTFMLPDLTVYSEDFRAFLEKDLIETSTLVSLEQAGRLNWWADVGACQRLLPLATTGDGNCLLHAASLGMWGFHDRLLTLRKALYLTLTNSTVKGALWREWRWHQILLNKQADLVYSEEEWEREWNNLLRLASTKPRSAPGKESSCCDSPATKGTLPKSLDEEKECEEEDDEVFYESLEEFHVFVLAHVLRRPIIVVADTMLKDSKGEAFAPIPFGGIYLPIQCDPKTCHRSPLVLTYDAAHFSALVAMEKEDSPDEKTSQPAFILGKRMQLSKQAVIPLVDPSFQLLPLHFVVDVGPNFQWGRDESDPQKLKNLTLSEESVFDLLKTYLNVVQVPIPKHTPAVLHRQDTGNTDSELETHSNSGSVESDEGTNSTSSSGSSKEKSKMAKQMQTVAKQFGSIGKTMSKKLKKNFGSISKAVKQMNLNQVEENVKNNEKSVRREDGGVGALDGGGHSGHPLGEGFVHNVINNVTFEMLGNKESILCAKLSHKRADYQQEMIKNYLHSAHERFEVDRQLKRQKADDVRMKVNLVKNEADKNKSQMKCINAGCNMYGTAATSYLCSSCYSHQKQQAMDLARLPPGGTQQQPFPTPTPKVDNVTVQHQTMVESGKSKFYTKVELGPVAHKPPLPNAPNVELNNARCDVNNSRKVVNSQLQRQSSDPNKPLELAHSKFYTNNGPRASPVVQRAGGVAPGAGRSSYEKALDSPSLARAKLKDYELAHNAAKLENTGLNIHGRQDAPPAYDVRYSPQLRRDPPQYHDVVQHNPLRHSEIVVNSAGVGKGAGLVNRHSDGGAAINRQKGFRVGEMAMQAGYAKALQTGYDQFDAEMEDALQQEIQKDPSRQKCKTQECPFYGSEATAYLCSTCFKQKQRTLAYLASKQTRL